MLRYILLIGIGGSSQGAKAVYEALHKEGQPEILFAETVSDRINGEIERKLAALQSPEEVKIIVISKSGKTMETKHNFDYFYNFLTKKFGTIDEQVIRITGDMIPKDVCGRFSVFTVVGTVPLELAGFDMKQFLAGKEAADEVGDLEAMMRYPIHNMFFFNPELESLGKWWRQLVAESLGKDGKGILPIVSIGTNDLHSMLQLYLDGPKNIYTTFVSVKPLPKLVEKILESVKQSYSNHQLPFTHYELPALNEFELGAFMQTRMTEVIRVAELMGVNPFNQPAVEEYKTIAGSIK